ncbi:putative transposase [Robbsia andropogonis]
MKTSYIYCGHRFSLSFLDIEELLLERSVVVSYESIRRWCDKFGVHFARQVKITERKANTWHLDPMFMRLRCERYWLWRAPARKTT